jgi:A/G-specific adenine glycosylase|tara:strand:+ start:1578 stop:2219 length:642 start_codon:yes stop_codon:yes gene_type:complete
VNQKRKVVNELLKWYKINARRFPWRRKKYPLYKLLVCEIFLWKTRADSVSKLIKEFFSKYPHPNYIRDSSKTTIVKDIKSLGLSTRRAKMLKKVFSNYNDRRIQKDEQGFRARFKVGQYIGRSVLSIYYDKNLLPVDQNIYRLIRRIFDYDIKNIRKVISQDEAFLSDFITYGGKEIIWAMIDYASIVCKEVKPKCLNCCVKKYCEYFKMNAI